jgi:hypothetical protein
MAMRPFGYKVPDRKTVGSSDWFGALLGADVDSTPYKVATLLPTDAGDLMKYGGLIGTFAGAKAKTANKGLLDLAERLEKSGLKREQIWEQTGWFRGPDKKWRFEIDDSKAVGRTYQHTPKEALKAAETDAIIAGEGMDKVNAMRPYGGMSKSQLADEYKRTGQDIVRAVLGGNKAEGMRLEDARAGLTGLLDSMGSRQAGPASVYLKHGELGAAYPDVYKMHTRIAPEELGTARGQYLRESPMAAEQLLLSAPPKRSPNDKSTMLHEMQHAIQQREGFAQGGNPGMFAVPHDLAAGMHSYDDLLRVQKLFDSAKSQGVSVNDVLNKSAPRWVTPEVRDLATHYGSMRNGYETLLKNIETRVQIADPMDAYRRLAGEAEARAVQARMNMTPAERRAKAPWESYDTPWEMLIVR